MRAGRTCSQWASLCAAALVLFQLGAILHLAVAPHGVCWEHGVVVDLESASAGHEGLAPATRPGLDRPPGRAVRSDAHPHCPALWVLREARPDITVTTAPVAHAEAGPPAPAPVPLAAPRGWALHCAPKQSPPA
jgi:hypothetical protein